MRDLSVANPALVEVTARRNSSLQSAYLILAARALELYCGPMSGFDNAKLDEEFFGAGKECEGCEQEFFPTGHVKSNFSVQSRLWRSRRSSCHAALVSISKKRAPSCKAFFPVPFRRFESAY